jgi:hypothetical protein
VIGKGVAERAKDASAPPPRRAVAKLPIAADRTLLRVVGLIADDCSPDSPISDDSGSVDVRREAETSGNTGKSFL